MSLWHHMLAKKNKTVTLDIPKNISAKIIYALNLF